MTLFFLRKFPQILSVAIGLSILTGCPLGKRLARQSYKKSKINSQSQSLIDRTVQNMSEVALALRIYRVDCKRFPSQKQGLKALIEAPKTEPFCKKFKEDGYIRVPQKIKDAFGNELGYQRYKGKLYLISLGEDGKEGGENENADLIYDILEEELID